jgi:hypothetical protein
MIDDDEAEDNELDESDECPHGISYSDECVECDREAKEGEDVGHDRTAGFVATHGGRL